MGEQVLSNCRIDFVSLANNHILDFKVPGMLETQRTLDAAGIRWAGAGGSLEEAARPAMLQVSRPFRARTLRLWPLFGQADRARTKRLCRSSSRPQF